MRFKILLVLTFSYLFAYGQNVFLRHYSVEDGLLSSEIYAQVQDSLGYMWFATSRGVSRFDGMDFTNFTVRNGLPTNSIITMFIDAYGRIWFAGYDGSLSYYDGERIVPYKFLDTVQKLARNFYINNFYVDSGFNLYLAPSVGGFYKIDTAGKVTDLLKNYDTLYNLVVKQVGPYLFFIRNPYAVRDDNFYVKLTDSALYIHKSRYGLRRFVAKRDNDYYVSLGRSLYEITASGIREIRKFDNEISGLFVDKEGNLWVSVLYTGAYVFKPGNWDDYIMLLKRKSPITVLQDNEESYWISTTESGIYYLPSFNFFNYSEHGFSDFNILSVDAYKDNIYFSTFDQQFYHCKVRGNKLVNSRNIKFENDKSFVVNDILTTPKGTVWLLGAYLGYFTGSQVKVLNKIWRGYALGLANDGGVLVTTGYGFYKYCGINQCFTFEDPRIPTSNSIYQDKNGTIWLGSINGLFSFVNDSLYFWGDINSVLKSRINNIAQYKDFILLATSGLGLVALRPSDSTIINITRDNGLTSDFITRIFVEDSVIWLGTNKGLVKITVTNDSTFDYRLENFTHVDGLYAEEIRDLARAGNTIFLGTSKGLVSFMPGKLKKQYITPKIIIDSITIDDQRIAIRPKITLKANQKSLTIYYKAISFRAGKNVVYRYKVKGYDNSWNITRNRYIRLPNLPAGHYTFYLTASAEPGIWSPHQIELRIVKRERFTSTTTFYFLLTVVFVLITGIIGHLIVRAKRRQLEQERQLMLAEQKALRSQMNPHFIFNALNSIRRFILENDMDKADYYLTSFATLMRRVLDNSRQNFITLENELQTLQLYLELERMRFDESFSFHIEVDPQIDIHNWLIPPMIIQPFAENAVWHGLAGKIHDGRLTLQFKLTDKGVLCVIEDNGIGRERAKQIAAKRKGHKSTGLSNTQERLQLLYKLYGKRIDLKIIDLYDENGEPAGTRVELLFPNFADVKLDA